MATNFGGYGLSEPQLHAILDFINATVTSTNGVSTLAALTDIASYNLPTGNTPLATALAAKAVPGLAGLNLVDVTASRALTLADFTGGVIRLNSAGVIAITLPTVAALALPATPGQTRMLAFHVRGGGIPTFAGATASTLINGTAGPATVLPIGGAPVNYGYYILSQDQVGADNWTLT